MIQVRLVWISLGKTSEVLQTLLCCQTQATVCPSPPCRAGRGAVQLGRSRVPPLGAAAAYAVTHSSPRRYGMKLGWDLPAPSLSLRLCIALVKTDCRRNSHVAVGRANGCVWSILMLLISGTKLWFVSVACRIPAVEEASVRVWRWQRKCFSKCINCLCGVGLFSLCIKELSLLSGEFYTSKRYRKETA